MELKISITDPIWDPNPEKTLTTNQKWKNQVVIVEFPNCSFKWMPTYQQMLEIQGKLKECEEINKQKCKEFYKLKEGEKGSHNH